MPVSTERQSWVRLLVNGCDGPREALSDYQHRGGYQALRRTIEGGGPEPVIELLAAAGLRGRGGANFPTADKWRMVCAEPGPRYLICNGGEHEPGSRKDIVLMSLYPHAVLEGVLIAAWTIGAEKAFIYLTEDQDEAIASIERAIEEERAARTVDHGVCDVQCIAGPATYVSGEETAIIGAIEGTEAKPRKKPPYPTVEGLWGRPTLVNNVETLANIPPLLLRGADWFRSAGTPASPGSALVTLSRGVRRPGVYEVPYGTTMREIIDAYGGGTSDQRPVKALLPGGPSLPFLGPEHLDTPFEHAALKEAGSGPGCGAIRVWLEGECMVEAAREIADFFAAEQCGQCPACRMETQTFAMALRQLSQGKGGRKSIQQMEKVADYARGKGLCSLLAMASAPALSAVRLFESDFVEHIAHGTCGAGASGAVERTIVEGGVGQ